MELLDIYQRLLDRFGPQYWWPMMNGFEPPEWEVCVGAILTQNTKWDNVEKALGNLKKCKILSPLDIKEIDNNHLETLIKPSGFYRQKAERLKTFADFVLGFGGFHGFSKKVTREQLLKVKGLGPETVDSILLYALDRPVFVIDAYTRRIFSRLGAKNMRNYEEWKRFFEDTIPGDTGLFREFHALIVEQGKFPCRNNPRCGDCTLMPLCGYERVHNKKQQRII